METFNRTDATLHLPEAILQATITTKGQVTLPKPLRDALQLKTGDKVLFEEKDGTFVIKAKTTDVKVLKGCIGYTGKPKTLDDMENAIINEAGSDS